MEDGALVVKDASPPENDEVIAEEMDVDDDVAADDDGHAAFNHAVAGSLQEEAIWIMCQRQNPERVSGRTQ